MSNAIRGRSRSEVEEILSESSRLVWTTICDVCAKRLDLAHVAILVGDPGSGKTVTAHMMICYLLLLGYEVYVSYDGIKEFEDVYQPDTKQVFFYDDFLGSNYFEAIQNHDDSKICQFVKRVSQDPTKRFILTSRTTILNRGLECSSVFKLRGFAQDNRLVDVNAVSDFDKAHILYKQLSSSCCNHKVLSEYVRDKLYWDAIRHRGYNPRVIEHILHSETIKSANSGRELASILNEIFHNPMKIWETVFENQINFDEHVLVWIVCLNWRISEVQLNEAFDKLRLMPNLQTKGSINRSFSNITRTLVGSLLKRIVIHERSVDNQLDELLGSSPHDEDEGDFIVSTSYELQNPSIADYLRHNWQKNILPVKLALELLDSKAALESFINMTKECDCSDESKRAVLCHLTSDHCTAKSTAIRLRAYAELVSGEKRVKDCKAAFAYVQNLNTFSIDQNGADSFVQILNASFERQLPVKEFLQRVSAEDIRQVFQFCKTVQNAIALFKLSPKSVFIDTEDVQRVISGLLVEYGHDLLGSWSIPELEFDEESGTMRASRFDVESAEKDLEQHFTALLSDANGLQDGVDVWGCVAEVDVAGFYETDCDSVYGPNDNPNIENSITTTIDNLFATLAQDP